MMEVQQFDLGHARPEEYAALSDFLNLLRAESWPGDPLVPLDERIRRWQSLPPYAVIRRWVLWDRDHGHVIAESELHFTRLKHNQHVADFHVQVLPEFRGQGLARRLLAPVVAGALPEGRTLLMTSTSSTVPSGEGFMRRLGARMGLAVHTNQLNVEEVDMNLIRSWQERAGERAADFELLVWEGRVPDEHLAAFAQLIGAMNFAPRGDLQLEDFHVTTEQIRQHEQAEAARGDQRWRLVTQEAATGRLAGYTEVIWHANRAELLQQGDTAVLPEFQNRGLGRRMKAAMIEKVLRERPEVRRIRTNNAYQNEPMLKINVELGFKPYRSEFIWQVETVQIRAYLESAGIRVTT